MVTPRNLPRPHAQAGGTSCHSFLCPRKLRGLVLGSVGGVVVASPQSRRWFSRRKDGGLWLPLAGAGSGLPMGGLVAGGRGRESWPGWGGWLGQGGQRARGTNPEGQIGMGMGGEESDAHAHAHWRANKEDRGGIDLFVVKVG
jgi:hypothetical protein